MVVIGITGGIAAGKSFVTRELGRRGAAVLDADRIGHAVLRLPEVKRQLLRRWGHAILIPLGAADGVSSQLSGQGQVVETVAADVDEPGPREAEGDLWLRGTRVNRAAVASRVFAPPPDGPRELAFLESVTHPRIAERLARRLERWRRGGRFLAAVLDAPVLYKAGWEAYCDTIWYVDAPWDVRVRRAADRGWSPEQLQLRQAMQPSLREQRERADVVVDNGGAPEQTTEQIEKFWQILIRELGG